YAGDVIVDASTTGGGNHAETTSNVLSIGFAASVSIVVSKAEVAAPVSAVIDGKVNQSASIMVTSNSTDLAHTGAFAAHVSGGTSATFDRKVSAVNAGSVTATAENNATAVSIPVAIGLVGVSVASVTAEILSGASVTASVGSGHISASGQDVLVKAKTTNSAT